MYLNSQPSDKFLENIWLLIHLLRRAGLAVSTDQMMDFTRALTVINIGDREQVYHAARCLLVSRFEHLQLFENIFHAFWRTHLETAAPTQQKMPHAPRHDFRPALVAYMASKAQANDPELDVSDKTGAYSDAEILQRKDFLTMTPEEMDAVKRLMQDMRWRAVLRKTRRRIPSRSGDMLHMRRIMASAVRYNGVPLVLTRQSRKIKQRPIVLIADISGSMEKYSRLVLQFFYGMSHSLKNVECFVFGTRLTRVTLQLKLKNIDQAVNEAAQEVVDWSGGTRIGESLAAFNRRWSRRVLRRGAIVMIVSDGWERGDVQQLQREMRYLQLHCHRLIWLNPLMGKMNYKPIVEGMAAALPYTDDFLPLHNLHSLSTLAKHLASLN
jgi:uncharacterized protein with von Willebrand factor type A (vWA) domain